MTETQATELLARLGAIELVVWVVAGLLMARIFFGSWKR